MEITRSPYSGRARRRLRERLRQHVRMFAESVPRVEPAGALVPIQYSQAQHMRPCAASEAFRFNHEHARHAPPAVLRFHVEFVNPRKGTRILGRLAARRSHDADESGGLLAAVRHEDAPIVGGTLRIQVPHVIPDDGIAARP